jgi:hypothetical protein
MSFETERSQPNLEGGLALNKQALEIMAEDETTPVSSQGPSKKSLEHGA